MKISSRYHRLLNNDVKKGLLKQMVWVPFKSADNANVEELNHDEFLENAPQITDCFYNFGNNYQWVPETGKKSPFLNSIFNMILLD